MWPAVLDFYIIARGSNEIRWFNQRKLNEEALHLSSTSVIFLMNLIDFSNIEMFSLTPECFQ